MKLRHLIGLVLLVGFGLSLGGCDDVGQTSEELKKIHQEIQKLRKEIRQIHATQLDIVPHLENLQEILKLTRREVGKNGDSIAGLRDHITLTMRSYAANGKEGASELGAEGQTDKDALVKQLRELGVELDVEAKTLTMRGLVAIPAGALEFACVAEGGKSHESLFMLTAEPRGLNAGLLALGLHPGTPGRFIPETGKPIGPIGPKVFLHASWTDKGKEVSYRLEDLIIDLRTQKPLVRTGFTYVGSRYQQNTVTGKRFYAADVTRDLVSVWNSQNTILDLATPEAAWDDSYVANSDLMPPKGTPIKVVVRLTENE